MKYQFILQFSQNSQNEFDRLIDLEDQLEEVIHSESEIDGHDIGNGQMNIFILTNEPVDLFKKIKNLLEKNQHILGEAKVAYREVQKNSFVVLWPNDLKSFEIT